MIERLFRGQKAAEKPYYKKFAPTIDWEWMLVVGVVLGAFLSAMLSGGFRGVWVPSRWAAAFGPSVLLRLALAFFGGILMGLGSRWAGGCTSGHGISGTLQLAVSGWFAVVFFFIGGITTAVAIFALAGR